MREVTRSLQPPHFASFRCLGADCEDTCCDGWAVTVDQRTYEKYQTCSDPQWHASFQQFVTITENPTSHDYARIQLSSTTCPFLSEGLCSIHKDLGEDYLSVTCASFPRVLNVVNDVVERSLDLGCPEAARQALLDPSPMAFAESVLASQSFSEARLSVIDMNDGASPGKPYRQFRAVRGFILSLLQNRALPISTRLQLVGFFCDKVQELSAGGAEARIPELIQSYQDAVSGSLFEDLLNQMPARPALRLETVLELIVSRITSDFTNRRFLACYKEFMEGIRWGSDSTMEEITARYQEAYSGYWAPFLHTHEHMLEHYLVNSVCRGLFPFGPQQSTYRLRDQSIERSIHDAFLLLAVQFSIIETLLGGMAGFHKEAFGAAQVIQVIYTFTRTFEHSLTFPQRAIQTLTEKGLNNPEGVAVLLKN